jgi:serine/threonine-protein kinase
MTQTAPALLRYAGPPTVPGYAVDEFLGRGSTGVVWAATRRDSGERVALKLLEVGEVGEVGRVDRSAAEREVALGRCVSGAHLARAVEHELLDDGRLVLVMVLADGGSLRDVVAIRGAVPLGEVVTALTPMATALAELHEAGVVHADVAPGNVLFTTDGRPMLADLSSAWLEDDGWPEQSLGTSGFTGPEVVLGRPPVPASDVWSLGALVWYARTGGSTPPAWVGDLHWRRGMTVADDPDDEVGSDAATGTPEDVTAAVGPELAPLVIRMLAEHPDARPSAAEVALALYRAAAPEPVGLVGHHPDPAAAITTRIRRDAEETRSRTQLREEERAERRHDRRLKRRRRVRRLLAPWVREAARGVGVGVGAGAAGDGEATPTASEGTTRSRTPSWRLRLVAVAVTGLVLAGGMLGLLRLTGGPLDLVSGAVSDRPPSATGSTADANPEATVTSDTATTAAAVATPGADDPAQPVPSRVSSAAVARDPVGVLQQLADRRVAALLAADPVFLVGAEPEGSSAHEADARTIARLREQRQRYVELAFAVRSAEVVSIAPTTAVLKAVVDRSAYGVVGEDGSTQRVQAGAGAPLRYTLTLTDGEWRLTKVGPS